VDEPEDIVDRTPVVLELVVYDGNDITGGEDELSQSPKFRKGITGK
jgi:hypothetical protein